MFCHHMGNSILLIGKVGGRFRDKHGKLSTPKSEEEKDNGAQKWTIFP